MCELIGVYKYTSKLDNNEYDNNNSNNNIDNY